MIPHVITTHTQPNDQQGGVWIDRIVPRKKFVRNSVHRHTYHELFIFNKGSGTHMIDMEVIGMAAPCIHIVSPGQVHKLDRSADCEGVVIMFQPVLDHGILADPRVKALLSTTRIRKELQLKAAQLVAACQMAEAMEKEQLESSETSNEILENMLAILLLKCVRWWMEAYPITPLSGSKDVVGRFVELVDKEFLYKKQVNAFASDLAISAGHLNELVKKRLGKSASAVIQERLLLEAKRLLLHADLSIKEIGFTLGVEDPAYFTRSFRKATGMTPVEYRTHIREKYQR